ncbi:hypothetical protein PWT90_01721 [Aphanocladium album]|nr:hypothetical protein PWT90_01721 [Aphanocladium album]
MRPYDKLCERLRRSAVAVVGDNGQPNSTGSPRLRPDDPVIGLYGMSYSFGQLLELPRQRQLGPPLTAEAMAYLQRLKAAANENVGVADAIKIESDSDDDPPSEVPPVPAPAFVQPAEPVHEAGRRDDWCRLCLPASITDYEAVLQQGSPERGAWLAYMMNAVDDWIRARIEDGSAYLSEGCRHRLGKLILELERSSSSRSIATGALGDWWANRAEYDAAMDRRILMLSRLKTNRPLQLGVDSCDDEYNAWLAAKVVFRKGVLDSICGEHPHMRERLEGELPDADQAV